MSSCYKKCLVPSCNVNSNRDPTKIFISVPKNPAAREKWVKIIGRTKPLSNKSVCYVCEDHFELENDMESYMRFVMMGGPLHLKRDVVPHKNLKPVFQIENIATDHLECVTGVKEEYCPSPSAETLSYSPEEKFSESEYFQDLSLATEITDSNLQTEYFVNCNSERTQCLRQRHRNRPKSLTVKVTVKNSCHLPIYYIYNLDENKIT